MYFCQTTELNESRQGLDSITKVTEELQKQKDFVNSPAVKVDVPIVQEVKAEKDIKIKNLESNSKTAAVNLESLL
jgi:hypothetical protein